MSPKFVVIGVLNGRNNTDPPLALPEDQAVEMLNVDRWDGMIARKRGGSDAVALTGGTAPSGGMQSLARFVPGADETLAELYLVDGAATPVVKRLAGGTNWANVTIDDNISTKPQEVVFAVLNGKLFCAYDSAVDRLHCYDPGLASPRIRRVGINPGTTAPTVADNGVGAYAATLRYYRVRFAQGIKPSYKRLSEPTPSVSFTPSGAGLQARITRPTAPGEGETVWFVEVSTDNATFVGVTGDIAIATTTADDAFVPATIIAAGPPSEAAGTYSLPTSAKVLLSDGNRLLWAGSWEGGKNSWIYYSPVLGSLDRGDDERWVNTTTQKNYLPLNENDGGFITGLGGPLNGAPYGFKYRQIWKLNPTGDVTVPYLPRKVTDGVGSLNHKSIVMAEDEAGRPALYFLSHKGPYRLGANGLQYLGRDCEDIWSTLNLAASTMVAHGVWYADIHQIWWWVATGSSADPDTRMVFDPLLGEVDDKNRVRNGWFKHTGDAAGARCSVMFSNTLGATMSRDLKPYFGRSSGTTLLKGNTSSLDDNGTAFQGLVTTRPVPIAPLGMTVGIGQSSILAEAMDLTLAQTIVRDYGVESSTASVYLGAAGTETRVLRKIEGSQMAGAGTIQVQIGNASAVATAQFVIDALTIPVQVQEPR